MLISPTPAFTPNTCVSSAYVLLLFLLFLFYLIFCIHSHVKLQLPRAWTKWLEDAGHSVNKYYMAELLGAPVLTYPRIHTPTPNHMARNVVNTDNPNGSMKVLATQNQNYQLELVERETELHFVCIAKRHYKINDGIGPATFKFLYEQIKLFLLFEDILFIYCSRKVFIC